jgi:hypothetical protein
MAFERSSIADTVECVRFLDALDHANSFFEDEENNVSVYSHHSIVSIKAGAGTLSLISCEGVSVLHLSDVKRIRQTVGVNLFAQVEFTIEDIKKRDFHG